MDENMIKEKLKEEYSCQYIAMLDYDGHKIIKALESTQNEISYRYFKVKEDRQLEEIVNDLFLAYFKSQNEINDENNY